MGKLISHDKVRGNMQAYLDDIGNKEGRDKCSVYSFYLSRQRVRLNRDPVIKFWNEVQAIYASKAEEVKQRKQLHIMPVKFVSSHHTERRVVAQILEGRKDWLAPQLDAFPDICYRKGTPPRISYI